MARIPIENTAPIGRSAATLRDAPRRLIPALRFHVALDDDVAQADRGLGQQPVVAFAGALIDQDRGFPDIVAGDAAGAEELRHRLDNGRNRHGLLGRAERFVDGVDQCMRQMLAATFGGSFPHHGQIVTHPANRKA